jgi:hypothetical protein
MNSIISEECSSYYSEHELGSLPPDVITGRYGCGRFLALIFNWFFIRLPNKTVSPA